MDRHVRGTIRYSQRYVNKYSMQNMYSLMAFRSKVLLFQVQFYPFVGLGIAAYLKAVGTARYLHTPVR